VDSTVALRLAGSMALADSTAAVVVVSMAVVVTGKLI
jgi:hypothetical protein